MKPKIIQTSDEHAKALQHVEALMDAEPGSPEEQELDLWALLIECYEQERFPIEEPDPIEAIKFRMDQLGLKRKDLEGYIGPKSKVSEVLNRKRSLSLAMIRALHSNLGIPAEILVREPVRARKRSQTSARRASRKAPARKQTTKAL